MPSIFPKISIITPSFNDAEFLETTILSLLSQEYPSLEYIIIDGGSTDGSQDIIKKYESKLKYWVSEKDDGMYHALQKGFDRSTGDIMGWINSDDMHHPGSLFTLAQLFTGYPEVSWLQGAPNIVDEAGRIVYVGSAAELDRYFFYQQKYIQSNRFIQQESTFWRRSLWEKAGNGISTDYKHAGDFDLWIRFFKYEKLYNLKTLLGAFRQSRSGQLSMDHYDLYVKETLEILEKNPLNEKEKKQLRYLKLLEKAETRAKGLNRKIRSKMNLDEISIINDRFHFEYRTQEFKM